MSVYSRWAVKDMTWGKRSWTRDQITSTDVFFKDRTYYTSERMNKFNGDSTGYLFHTTLLGAANAQTDYPRGLRNIEKSGAMTYEVYYQRVNGQDKYIVWFYAVRGSTMYSSIILDFEGFIDDSDGNSKPADLSITTTYGTPPETTGTIDFDVYTGTDYEPGLLGSNSGYTVDVDSVINFDAQYSSIAKSTFDNTSQNILGMFGIPYQFMPHVDPRLSGSITSQAKVLGSSDKQVTTSYANGSYVAGSTACAGTGREWAYFIASTMPILFISPGLPNFMGQYSDEDKGKLTGAITNFAAGLIDKVETSDLISKNGKYYTFEYQIAEFYYFCNPVCRIASAYMGVSDMTLDGKRLDTINWKDYTCGKLSSAFGNFMDATTYAAIPFYIESETQISESFSNDVTDSSLAGWVDGFSELGREAMFLLGYGQSALNINLLDINADASQAYSELAGGLDDNNLVSNILQSLASVATGGRLIFPKIWSDSGFTRSYDVTIKLRSPDMDPKSIYLNIILPYLHIWCCAVPRAADGNPNAMYSPFLVRCIYKGFFNVDMGIISSMSVTKGDQAQWTPDGIPSAIDVNITITDLYENISMSKSEGLSYSNDALTNTNMMDYIANLCGVNIYQPEIGRTMRMILADRITNRARDALNIGVWGNIQNTMANAITRIWRP